MSTREAEKRLAAARAVDEIKDGMFVGLGTGSTTAYAIKSLSDRIRQGLRITAVATSRATEMFARRLAVPLVPFEQFGSVDLTIDGADEIDCHFQAIKGGGGALLREKVVAAASIRMIAVVDSSKVVRQLGEFPLAVEVVPFASEFVRTHLANLGASVTLRSVGGEPFITDQSNHILDAAFGKALRPIEIAGAIDAIPGVMEHGLFLSEIDTVVVGRGETVEVHLREQAPGSLR
jgi:ribose 5-phosphate isomerase A